MDASATQGNDEFYIKIDATICDDVTAQAPRTTSTFENITELPGVNLGVNLYHPDIENKHYENVYVAGVTSQCTHKSNYTYKSANIHASSTQLDKNEHVNADATLLR